MRRIIIFIFCLFLLTGCDVVYNIDIDNNDINESTNIYFAENDYNYESYYPYGNAKRFSSAEELVEKTISSDYKAFDSDYNNKELYKMERVNDEIGEGVNFKYTYKYNNIKYSSLINYCGQDVKYINNNDSVSLNVDNLSLCVAADYGPRLNNLTVNIKTDLKVTDNNADKVKGNRYTWTFDSNDFYDKSIKIVMQKNKNLNSSVNSIGKIVIIILMLLVISIIIYKIIRKRYLSENSI